MYCDLKGKTVAITGALTGIGKQMALSFARLGCNVAVISIDENGKDTFFPEGEKLSGDVKFYICDVCDYDKCGEVVSQICADFGRLDVLVNNAGITKDGLLVRMSKNDFDKVLDVNLTGTFNMTRHAATVMFKAKSGRIINISSVVGIGGNFGQSNYCASKAGVIGFTKAASKELGPRGITVNAIAPGFIQTAMTDVLDDKVKQAMLDRLSLKRMGQPEDISSLALFLASDSASYITGQVIQVDGGIAL